MSPAFGLLQWTTVPPRNYILDMMWLTCRCDTYAWPFVRTSRASIVSIAHSHALGLLLWSTASLPHHLRPHGCQDDVTAKQRIVCTSLQLFHVQNHTLALTCTVMCCFTSQLLDMMSIWACKHKRHLEIRVFVTLIIRARSIFHTYNYLTWCQYGWHEDDSKAWPFNALPALPMFPQSLTLLWTLALIHCVISQLLYMMWFTWWCARLAWPSRKIHACPKFQRRSLTLVLTLTLIHCFTS